MLYTRRTFTLPASEGTSEMQWDLAFLTKEEFKAKYKLTDEEYTKFTSGE